MGCSIINFIALASPTSSRTSRPSTSPGTTCVEDTSVKVNEFVVGSSGSTSSGPNFEVRGPSGQSFTGNIVIFGSARTRFRDTGDVISFTDPEQIETVSGTFDSNGLLQVSIADYSSTFFTMILCSEFTSTTNEISLQFDNTRYAFQDTSIFGTIYDVVALDPGPYPGFMYPIIESSTALIGTYFTSGYENNYNFAVIFRDSCTLDMFAVTTSSDGTSLLFVGHYNSLSAFRTVYELSDFSPNPSESTIGAINPKLMAIA